MYFEQFEDCYLVGVRSFRDQVTVFSGPERRYGFICGELVLKKSEYKPCIHPSSCDQQRIQRFLLSFYFQHLT